MYVKPRQFPGVTTTTPQPYEAAHRTVARQAAAEGFVLLKNDNHLLPIPKGTKLALYGPGASHTIKGGTGSGDVNPREVVSLAQGLKAAGYAITTEDWLRDYEARYTAAREAWRDLIWYKLDAQETPDFFEAYSTTPFVLPSGAMPQKTDAQIALYVLSRIAGENADRHYQRGDYLLSSEERAILSAICALYPQVVVVLNVGGPVDLSFLEEFDNIHGLIQISQPGMEGGNAFAEVLSGTVTPSGKLTDTWALRYEDYPNAATFSHNNGDVEQERYEEGIFVGYRYFDSFSVPTRYGFGFGLSYTTFALQTLALEKQGDTLTLSVEVINTGNRYPGKEVVQVYASCPQGTLGKEYRRLVAFQKTDLLAPGGRQVVELSFPLYALTSYSETAPGWLLEAGIYGLFVGSSLESAVFAAAVDHPAAQLLVKTQPVCPLQTPLQELTAPADAIQARRARWLSQVDQVPHVTLSPSDVTTETIVYGTDVDRLDRDALAFVDTLTVEQLIQLSTGDPSASQDSNLGAAGMTVPGSAAQTSACSLPQGLADLTLADGPAGLRLTQQYTVRDGAIVPQTFERNLEGGFLARTPLDTHGEVYYQFCTAMPVGTLLAQSWNPALLEAVGAAVAQEMQRFEVTLWLAPGMNIHRNPLCGRNFEYYSEDPLLTGKLAAAITRGVQQEPGCGTTIKHFACNNQEDNRMHSDSILSERTLREIYLKGFELAVKEAQPFSIMTSYNLINGVHAANCYDLCTKVARDEWGFDGVIMTDWNTTHNDPTCTASGCVWAGNDLVMPGIPADHDSIRQALADGTLDAQALKRNIARLVSVVWKSNRYA